MEILSNILVFFIMAIIGGIPCLYMTLSIPAVIGWKIYRKFKYNLSLYG